MIRSSLIKSGNVFYRKLFFKIFKYLYIVAEFADFIIKLSYFDNIIVLFYFHESHFAKLLFMATQCVPIYRFLTCDKIPA